MRIRRRHHYKRWHPINDATKLFGEENFKRSTLETLWKDFDTVFGFIEVWEEIKQKRKMGESNCSDDKLITLSQRAKKKCIEFLSLEQFNRNTVFMAHKIISSFSSTHVRVWLAKNEAELKYKSSPWLQLHFLSNALLEVYFSKPFKFRKPRSEDNPFDQ